VTWRCAITTNVVILLQAALGPSVGIVNLAGTTRLFVIARATVLISTIGLLGLLVAQRKHPRLRTARLAFALPAAPVLVMYWFLEMERAAQELPVELFVRQVAASTAFAIATPPGATALSLVAVGAFFAENLLLFWAAHRFHLWQIHAWQPWSGLLAAACLALLALYRSHRLRREVAMIVDMEQAKALRHILRVYLAVRDMVNTPLQTLRVSASLLATRYPEAKTLTGRVERAVGRLIELNRALAAEASATEWPSGAEAFDPTAVLRTARSRAQS
jgi:hypothetical protein